MCQLIFSFFAKLPADEICYLKTFPVDETNSHSKQKLELQFTCQRIFSFFGC